MSKMDILQKYFPTGTTEGDRQILSRIFVAPDQLPDVLAMSSGSPRLLVGNKGVGKTAILEWLFAAARKKEIPSLFLRPDDLDTSKINGLSDVASIKREMYECFLDAVACSLGENLSGYLKGDAAKIYRESVARGAREPDWMGKLVNVLGSLSRPVTEIDAQKLAADLSKQTLSQEKLLSSIQNHLLDEGSIFLILFDDTDQIASPNDPQHLNRIWGLLLAIRKLTSNSPNIKCIINLRMEVWMRLLRNEKGQRDQIDHFRPLVMFLRAPEQLIKSIFNKRVSLAALESGFKGNQPITHFFDDPWMQLPTSTERRSWDQFLLKSSRERPRDMVQLVNHLAKSAKERGVDRIGDVDAEKGMEYFSKERAEDLGIEMGYDCPQFLDVIRSFVDLDFESEFEDLRKHLRSIPSRFSVQIGSKALNPDNDDDAIKLLSLLHESGFLNARVSDKRETKNYKHVTFLDDPHLTQMSRWNDLQAAQWEVHPVFRTYLLGLIKERDWRK